LAPKCNNLYCKTAYRPIHICMVVRASIPFPVKLLEAAKFFGLMLLAGSGFYIWSSWQTIASLQEREFPSIATFAALGSANENQIATARIAVGTADASWRRRYFEYEAGGQSLLARLKILAPAEFQSEAGRQLIESAARLRAIEKRALDLAAGGETTAASALLFGEAYGREERVLYANGYRVADLLRGRLQTVIDFERRRGKLAMTCFCVGLPLLLVLWIFSLRFTIRHLDQKSRSDARLQESEERLSTLFEGIDDTLFVHDTEGRILDCNGAACRRLGYKREELLAMRTSGIDAPEFAAGFAQRCVSQLAAGAYVCEGVHLAKDGTRIPVDINTRVIAYRGKPAILALARDITGRKRAELELELLREAAEAANSAKSQFLANMSHEIRTPMNGIVGMTELALATDLSAEQREYLQMAHLSGESLLALINDILDFSKIEAGRLSIEAVELQLREVLAAAIQPLAIKAREKHLDLVYQIPRTVPEKLIGDSGRLTQIIVNLVSNAIKFTDAGEVALTVEATSIEEGRVDLLFKVTDTGIGIPENMLAPIFQPFRQADSSITRRYGGTGLGLAISAQLAGLMGGEIWAESGRKVGSAFHFRVSLGMPQAQSKSAPVPGCDLRGMPVLVVDENAAARRSLEETLSEWGMAPAAVDGIEAAVAALDEASRNGRPIALLLADAASLEKGADLAGRIRQRPLTPPPAIILLTGAGPHVEAEQPQGPGIGAHLRKPFTRSELLDAIATVMALASMERMSALHQPTAAPAATFSPRRVLVAEDNPVNQRLLRRILEKRGHSVALASNGREALEAIERESFDIALFDVQMPEMSGIEATAAIRARERDQAAHGGVPRRLPICAITANAMKGDREFCLAAGMDTYIAKPIHQSEVFEVVEHACIIQGSDPEVSFDGELFDGDPEFLAEIVNLFVETCPDLLREIETAVSLKDADGLRRAAHAIKGAVANFGARAVVEQAGSLEEMGRQGDFAVAGEGVRALRVLLEKFLPEMQGALRRVQEKQVLT
jgi:two-component system sensor histidine kinase/response regulator